MGFVPVIPNVQLLRSVATIDVRAPYQVLLAEKVVDRGQACFSQWLPDLPKWLTRVTAQFKCIPYPRVNSNLRLLD